jgi:AcrR family transcriptional regulator
MGRWQPETSERLQKAAIELFQEQGYDQTTVADIAGRAGLTARTFFRYFTDKREVLFHGSTRFNDHLVQALAAAPSSASPFEAVAIALKASGELLSHREWSGLRQDVIDAHPELRERELIKMASLAAALADGLRQRGVPDPQAGLAAAAGVAVFRVGFERWLTSASDRPLADVLDESFAQLRALTTS